MRIGLLSILLCMLLQELSGQCPDSDFTITNKTCKNNVVSLANNSTNADTYVWDFDAGDLSRTPTASTIISDIGSSIPTNIEIKKDGGNWYGFVSSRANHTIYRLDFGSDLSSTPDVNALTISGLSTPEGFQLYKESGNWYAIVLNGGSSTLSRIDFGTSLTSDNLSASGLVSVGAVNSTMKLIESADTLVVSVTNFSSETISFIPFGNSITNTPVQEDVYTTSSISGTTDIIGLEIFYECENWYGIVNGFTSKTIVLLNFGSDLFSNPSPTTIANSSQLNSSNPIRTYIEREGGKYMGIISSRDGHIYRVDLGSYGLISSGGVEDLGNFSDLDRLHAFTLIQDNSSWHAFGVHTTANTLFRIDFPNQSSQATLTSDQELPSFSYEEEGVYTVQLNALDSDGQISFSTQTITIDNGPNGDFSFSGYCSGSSSTFNASSTDNITDWSWDFGDGNFSSGQSVNHTYSMAGDYIATLTLTRDDGCTMDVSKNITIIDSTPVPAYTYSSANSCSFTEFSFTNTTSETGLEDIISYDWDFNGEASSTEKSPTYTFETSGTKSVSLTASIPGCSSEIFSQNIDIEEGPNVSFTYSNNCFGEAILFTDQSSGDNITGYSWDFGDGSPINNNQNPSHTFSVNGDYDVELTVSNVLGCQNTYTQTITISDDPKADFSFNEAVENLPVSFSGEDLTIEDDSVINWSWNFDDLGSSDEQSPSFTFSTVGDYSVSLDISTAQGCDELIEKTVSVSAALAPTVSFSILTPSSCLNENVPISNNSINASGFYWDFCPESYKANASLDFSNDIPELSEIYDLSLVSSGNQAFALVSDFDNNDIARITFDNYPLVASTDFLSTGISSPKGIKTLETQGNWFALVTNADNDLFRLSFGDDLSSTPTVELIDNMGVADLRALDVVSDSEGNFYAIIAAGGTSPRVITLDFGSSLANIPTIKVNTAAGNYSSDVALFQESGNWYAVLSTVGSGLLILDFGNDIMINTPVISNITTIGNSAGLDIIKDDTGYTAFYTNTSNSSLFRADFGSSINNTEPSIEDLGNFGVLSTSIGVSLLYHKASYSVLIGGLSTQNLTAIAFEKNCEVSQLSSSQMTPGNISFSNQGDHLVKLNGYNDKGVERFNTSTISISSFTAPSISFSVDDNQCISNPNNFTAIDEGNINSYSWDFNNDGIEDDNSANPEYQFLSIGEHLVTLTVESTDGCSNEFDQEISIYNPPSTPSFDYSPSAACSNSEVSFTNTTSETGLEDIISYDWDFNGEASSTEKSPTYTFETSGTKSVSLTASIPGCSSEIFSQNIDIEEGPNVSFTYSNNCFGEAILFTDQSSGDNITGYSWDFGDGSPINNNQNPSHTFSVNGDYDVELTVSNVLGCQNTYTQTITISDDPKADFSFNEAVENLPVSFSGEDLTIEDDSVINWSWNFDDLGSSDEQSPSFTFSTVGDYSVSLDISTAQGCDELIEKTVSVSAALAPTVSFSILTPSSCLNENVPISNNSINASGFYWDFCPESYKANASLDFSNDIPELSEIYDLSLVSSGNQAFALVSDFDNNDIARITFDNYPLVASTDFLSTGISSPKGIKTLETQGNWFALVTNADNDLFRLSFGDDLSSTPTVELIDNMGVADLRALDVVSDSEGNFYAIIAAGGTSPRVITLDFGSSLANIPTIKVNTAAGNYSSDVALFQESGNWYAVLSTVGSGLLILDFGNDIMINTPVISNITTIGNSAGLDIIKDDTGYTAFYTNTSNSSLFRADFGSSINNTEPSIEDLGNFGVLSTSIGVSLLYHKASYSVLIGGLSTQNLTAIAFEKNCEVSQLSSSQMTPGNISFSNQGDHLVKLNGYNDKGVERFNTSTISISSFTAPSISFSVDDNQCISNPNNFTAIDEGNINSYSWDFNNDGIEDDNSANPEYTFGATGNFPVRLSVDDGTCANFIQDTISIYPAPPVPVFDLSAEPYCTNTGTEFTNRTDESEHVGANVSYQWDFNGEGTSAATDTTFSFTVDGLKDVTLTMSIPGCATPHTETMAVIPGPANAFSFENDCFGETSVFTNATTGDNLINPFWDFGDGYTTNEYSPDHAFEQFGDYEVTLTMENEEGCVSTLALPVRINGNPTVDFTHDLSCEGQTTTFTDQSMPGDTLNNVDAWQWDFAGLGGSTERNPEFLFETEGTYDVVLNVTNEGGCMETLTRTITVNPTPVADFAVDLGCLGEETEFVDLSTTASENPLDTWYWTIDGEVYQEQNAMASFSESGGYLASLIVTGINRCSNAVQQNFEVFELPSMAYDYSNACDNEFTVFMDYSSSGAGDIVSRTWQFDDLGSGNGAQAGFNFTDAGEYEISLTVTDELGCISEMTDSVIIHAAPTSTFDVSTDLGPPPLVVNYSNQSIGSETYFWQFNDENDSTSTQENPTFSYASFGTYTTALISQSSEGCRDTSYMEIAVDEPILDLELTRISSVEENGKISLMLDISNSGSLHVNGFDIRIDIEGGSSIFESYEEQLPRHTSITYPLNFSLPSVGNNVEFVCIKLQDRETEYQDSNPFNNEGCINFEQELVVQPSYPNPLPSGSNELRLDLVIPAKSPVQIVMSNNTGKVVYRRTFSDINTGLNTFLLDFTDFRKGMYFLNISYNDVRSTQKIVKM